MHGLLGKGSALNGMRRFLLAASTALVLLICAAPAQAAYRSAPFCGSLNPTGGYVPMTLKPGQACTFLPTAVQSAWAAWHVSKDGSYGFGVCVAVVEYPPGWPSGRPLSPTGSGPGNYWQCVTPYAFANVWQAHNGFNAVYGQAVLLNGSNATIVTDPTPDGGGDAYGRIYYYN
jgi:hypothetical protein